MIGCRVLDKAEITRLLGAAKHQPRVHLAVLLQLTFGLRVSECLSLRFGDFSGTHLYVRALKGSRSTTFAIPRAVAQAVVALRGYYSLNNRPVHDGTFLFFNPKTPTKAVTRQMYAIWVKTLFDECGITGGKLATNTLRKTFAAEVYARIKAGGGDVLELQKYMRHVAITSTIHYLEDSADTSIVCDLPWAK